MRDHRLQEAGSTAPADSGLGVHRRRICATWEFAYKSASIRRSAFSLFFPFAPLLYPHVEQRLFRSARSAIRRVSSAAAILPPSRFELDVPISAHFLKKKVSFRATTRSGWLLPSATPASVPRLWRPARLSTATSAPGSLCVRLTPLRCLGSNSHTVHCHLVSSLRPRRTVGSSERV